MLHNSIEIFTNDQKNYFFCFYNNTKAIQVLKSIEKFSKHKLEIVENLPKHFEKMGYTKKWEQGYK